MAALDSVAIGHGDALTVRRGTVGPRGDVWSLRVRLVGEDLVAEANVEPEGVDCMLDDFFARLASEWPWSDERQWTSRGDGLTLTCTHDALGHIRVAVELRRVSRGSWRHGQMPWWMRASWMGWRESYERC